MNKISKPMKISLWLTSIGLAFLAFSFVFCALPSFKLSFGTIGGSFNASLFTLMFGGSWNQSGSRIGTDFMPNSPYLITSFVLMLLSLFAFIFIIYGITCDNINYKHRVICGAVAIVLLILATISLFFIKQYVAIAFVKAKEGRTYEDIIKRTSIESGTYVVISFIITSIVCYVGAMINSLIGKKIHK